MKVFLYLFYAIASLLVTISAFFLAPILSLFLDNDKNLKYGRLLFQPSDNPAIGDYLWKVEHPTYSDYQLAVTYQWRNPAQGFDQLLQANVTMQTPCKLWGYITTGNYLITGGGYFHLSYKLGWITGGFGWRLNNIVQSYEHPTMGQFIFTIFRFHQ